MSNYISCHPNTERSYKTQVSNYPGKNIIIYANGKRIIARDVSSQSTNFFSHREIVTATEVSQTLGLIASSDKSGRLVILDLNLAIQYEFTTEPATHLSFYGYKVLATCGRKLLCIDLETEKIVQLPSSGQLVCTAVSSEKVAVIAQDGSIQLFSPDLVFVETVKQNCFPLCAVFYNKALIVGALDGNLYVFGEEVRVIEAHKGAVYNVKIADGHVLTSSGDQTLKQFNSAFEPTRAWRVSAGRLDYGFDLTGLVVVDGLTLAVSLNSLFFRAGEAEILEQLEIGFNKRVEFVRRLDGSLMAFQSGLAFDLRTRSVLANGPANRVLCADRFGDQVIAFTPNQTAILRNGAFGTPAETALHCIAARKLSEEEALVICHNGVFTFNVINRQVKLLFRPEKDCEVSAGDYRDGVVALSVRGHALRRERVFLLSQTDGFQNPSKFSDYFVAVSLLSLNGSGLLAGGTDSRLCYYLLTDFAAKEVEPTNGEMDHGRSTIGRPTCALFKENIVYICGDNGVLKWDVSVTKRTKVWEALLVGVQCEVIWEDEGGIYVGGEDATIRKLK